jgi:integrase/recombinase XerD
LLNQRKVSSHTIAACRHALRLLLTFAQQQQQTGKQPSRLDSADLDAPWVGAFLNHLERDRGNSPKTRNARLAAIHSLFRYSALRHPEHAASIARVLEIPNQRHRQTAIAYLDRSETEALLAAPDRSTWLGRRDHAMLLVGIQTGVRVSELVNLTIDAVSLSTGAHLRVTGKATRNAARSSPARPSRSCANGSANVTASRRSRCSRPAAASRSPPERSSYGSTSTPRPPHAGAPTLNTKRVTSHVLRHTNAMLLRAENVDIYTIALWLGHASIKSTEIYLHADNKLKQQAIERAAPTGTPPGRYRPPDQLLAVLETL